MELFQEIGLLSNLKPSDNKMILKKVHIFHYLLLFVFESVAQIPDDLFGDPISSLFEVVKSKYEGTLLGLNTYITTIPSEKNYTINFLPVASNRLSSNKTILFYGKDAIMAGENTYDYGLHKLFFKKDWEQISFSTGIGYDYDGVNELYVGEAINTTENRIFESHKTLLINKWIENSIFANVNSTLHYSPQKWLISGVEIVHSIKNGIEYVEKNESTLNSLREYNDIIHYHNYDKGAFKNRLTIGAGLLKEFLSKRGNERLFLSYVIYERSREHSNLSVLDGVRSYFNDWVPDNVQFSGKDNHSNSIAVTCALTDRDPYKLYFDRKWNAHFEVFLKSVDLEVKMSGIVNKTQNANVWNFEGTFYGRTERVSTHYPLTIHGEVISEILMFSFFNLRLDSDLNSTIERYLKNEISSWNDVTISPYIGFTFPIKNRALIDFHYSPIISTVDVSRDNNSFSFGFDVLFHNVFQLRLSLVKNK
jgi:hypothetical protein